MSDFSLTTAGSLIFKPFAKKSPFLVNQMDSYFLGGTHDMASWSTRLMEDTAYMLDHGICSFSKGLRILRRKIFELLSSCIKKYLHKGAYQYQEYQKYA